MRRRPLAEVRLLAAGRAAGLSGIDLWYASRRRIRPVYLTDAATEMVLGLWQPGPASGTLDPEAPGGV